MLRTSGFDRVLGHVELGGQPTVRPVLAQQSQTWRFLTVRSSSSPGRPCSGIMKEMVVLQVLALVGYSGFLSATFGWRTLQTKRATGESRWREPISRTDAIGETVCAAGCLLSLVAALLAMTGAVRPLRTGWPTAQGIGFAVTLGLGTTLAVWAQRHLAEEWRVGVEASDTLVTAGPFARIRNPFYLGCFLASASVLIALPSTVALAGLALHIAAAEIMVRGVEEPILAQAHGPAFSDYKQRTGRFLPRINLPNTPSGWSWRVFDQLGIESRSQLDAFLARRT